MAVLDQFPEPTIQMQVRQENKMSVNEPFETANGRTAARVNVN